MQRLKSTRTWIILIPILAGVACTLLGLPNETPSRLNPPATPQPSALPLEVASSPEIPLPPQNEQDMHRRIQPEDLEYLGAFRLPDGPDEIGWAYSGEALAFYPGGDPADTDDEFPGSLFGTGHNWNQYISEISIPPPIISPDKNPLDLNVATTLQGFQNIRGNLFSFLDFEIPRVGLAILPRQGEQTSDKLYFCWHQHLGQEDRYPTHGWSELDLSNPHTAGPWKIDDLYNYLTCDYMFEIPEAWASENTPGNRLATGRFRDGGQAAQGPALFAIGPWNQGNPPAKGSILPATVLLLYSSITSDEQHLMLNYHHSDEWAGGAWLTAGEKSAVVFVGTKGVGDCWYGCNDGTVWPDEPPFPEDCPDPGRGWWSTRFEGQMIFYDPADLAKVARGEMESWQPQPYAVMPLDEILYHVQSGQEWYHVGAAAFDRQRGYLYMIEPLADEDKSIIHVWRVLP